MWFLTLTVWLAYAVLFIFATVCLACGLYYLAELVEEYTTYTKKILKLLISFVLVIHVFVAIFEDFPFFYVVLGFASHCLYFSLLSKFPLVELLDPKFLASIVAVCLNHSAWFVYFTNQYYPFKEILTIFVLCVWLVPFGFFISLSANENTLPYGNVPSYNGDAPEPSKKSHNRLLGILNYIKSILPNSLTGRQDQKLF